MSASVNVNEVVGEPEPSDPPGYQNRARQLGPLIGAERLGATVYELPEGQSTCPYHYEYGREEWLFVLSGNDPGLDEIAEYFGAQGRRLRRQPNVMFRMLDGADHTLSAHWFRDTLLGLIALFLRERCNIAIDTGEAKLLASIPIRVMSPRLEAALIRPIAPASLARGSVAIDTSGSAA